MNEQVIDTSQAPLPGLGTPEAPAWTPDLTPDDGWSPDLTPDDQLKPETILPEASKHLAAYRAGEGQHLLPEDASALDAFKYLHQQEVEAMGNKPTAQRQIEAVEALPGQIRTALEGAKKWITNLFQKQPEQEKGPEFESGLDYQAAKTGKPTPKGSGDFLEQFSKETATGGSLAKMVGALADMTAFGVNQNILGPGMTQAAEAIPQVRPWIQEVQAVNNAAADYLNGRITEETKKVAPKIGLDPESTGAMIADLVPWFANIPGMEFGSAEGISKSVNYAARALELSKIKAAEQVIASAPAMGKVTKAVSGVAGAELLRQMGLEIPHGAMDIGGAIAGMMLPDKIFKSSAIADRIAAGILDVPVEDVPFYLKAAKQAAPNVPIREAMANAIDTAASKKLEAAADKIADLKPRTDGKPHLVERKNADGSWMHDTESLPADQRPIREDFEKAQALQQRAKIARQQSDASKVLSDIKTWLANSAVHTLQGAAVGTGFQEATSPTGAPQGGEGALLGAFLAAPLSPLAGYSGMQANRLGAAARALVAAGSKIVDPKQLEGLSPGAREYVLKMAAMNEAAGAKGTNVLSPDELRAKHFEPAAKKLEERAAQLDASGNIKEGDKLRQQAADIRKQEAPFGVTNPDGTIDLNRQALGAAGHEIVHPMQELFGRLLADKDPQFLKDFEAKYRSMNGGKGFNTQEEWEAEIGRIAMEKMPPEVFYGGEKGFDIIKRVLRKWTQSPEVKVDPIINAPYTEEDLAGMRKHLFEVGRRAASPEARPSGIPDVGEPPPAAPAPETPASPAHEIAVDALKATGIDAKSAAQRVAAAAQDLANAGEEVNLDNLLRRAFQRSAPETQEMGAPAGQNIPDVGGHEQMDLGLREGNIGFKKSYMPGTAEMWDSTPELNKEHIARIRGLSPESTKKRFRELSPEDQDKIASWMQPKLMPNAREPAIQLKNGMILTGEDAADQATLHGLSLKGATEGFVGDKGHFVPADLVDRQGRYDTEELYNRTKQYMPGRHDAYPPLEAVIHDYTDKAGIKYVPHKDYRPDNEGYRMAIADAYDMQQHRPDAPEVKKGYEAFWNAIKDQYHTLVKHGFKIEPWMGEGQPYANSSEMLNDLRNNKHLYYFRTEIGYGEKGGSTPQNHPMLKDSGIVINGQRTLRNDIFRGVHDALGHGVNGWQFGPRGEYNAFLTHASTLPHEAWGALATETLGQNSFTNYGPHMRDEFGRMRKPGDPDYLPITQRPYTEQRADLLKFMPFISKEEARGNSRGMSMTDFNTYADRGEAKLRALRAAKQSIEGLETNWDNIVNQSFDSVQKPWGGLTISPVTGKPVEFSGRQDGPFALSAREPGEKGIELPIGASQEEFANAMQQAADEFPLDAKKHYLGVFRDESKGTIDIDPILIVDTPKEAEEVGAYTHATGGAYNFTTGEGHFPPHVDPEKSFTPTRIRRTSELSPRDVVSIGGVTKTVSSVDGNKIRFTDGSSKKLSPDVKAFKLEGKGRAEPQLMPGLPGFYSKLEEVMDQKLPGGNVSHAQVRGILANSGIKKAEIEWNSPLVALLDSEITLPKKDWMEAIRAGTPKVTSKTFSERAKGLSPERIRGALVSHGATLQEANTAAEAIARELPENWTNDELWDTIRNNTTIHESDVNRTFNDLLDEGKESETRYGEYKLNTPGGRNYREILFHLQGDAPQETRMPKPLKVTEQGKRDYDLYPRDKDWWIIEGENDHNNNIAFIREEDGKYFVPSPQTADQEFNSMDDAIKFAVLQHKQLTGEDFSYHAPKNLYNSPHFGIEAGNLLGHLRVTDEPTADGKNMLFIQEAQSDWAQAIRKEKIPEWEDLGNGVWRKGAYVATPVNDKGPAYAIISPEGTEFSSYDRFTSLDKAKAAIDDAWKKGSVADMPFKGEAWKRLLLRQAIKEAVDAGQDSIGWTTGYIQNKRYGLSSVVSAIRWGEGTIPDVPAADGSKRVYLFVKGGADDITLFIDKNGNITSADHDRLVGRHISDAVGAGIAKQIMGEEAGEISGTNLDVGGSGMKGFYDKELVNIANDIGKKYGAKTQEGHLATGQRINPELRISQIVRGGEARGYGLQNPHNQWLSGIDEDGRARFADTSSGAKKYSNLGEAADAASQIMKTRSKDTEKIWELPITDKLREEVQKRGQPLFMPATDAGRKLEEQGFRFSFNPSYAKGRHAEYGSIALTKNGQEVASLNYNTSRDSDSANLDMVIVSPEYRGQGIGDALYRELGALLQKRGFTNLEGIVVHPAAEKTRSRVFPDTQYTVTTNRNAYGDVTKLASSRIPADAKFMPPTLNIGLDIGDKKGALHPDQVLAAIERAGAVVTQHSVQTAPSGEKTVVASIQKPLEAEAAAKLSADLGQEAIAQWDGLRGEVYGPQAEEWRPFDHDQFVDHNGKVFGSEGRAQQQNYEQRTKNSPVLASGIWDRGTIDPNSGTNIPDIAAQIGVPDDKRFFQQKPADQQKIRDYFRETGEAQFMPAGEIQKRKPVDDYLIWEPQGELRDYADHLNTIPLREDTIYRGASKGELDQLLSDGTLMSDNRDVSRKRPGTYFALDPGLAGRFTIRNARDTGSGIFIEADKNKIKNLVDRAEAVATTEPIPADAIRRITLYENGQVKDVTRDYTGREQYMPGQKLWDEIAAHLDDEELASFRDNYKQKIIKSFKKLDLEKGLEYAKRGAAGRKWYHDSVQAIRDLLDSDIPERRSDPDRFAGLLAALSPNRAVSSDLTHSLQAWAEWERLGRPQDRGEIDDIIARTNVKSGEKETANMPAYLENAFRVLTADDPAKVKLSGPKVDPFFANLRGDMNKVTNDRHMGFYGYGDVIRNARREKRPGEPGKSRLIAAHPGIALTAHVRQIAKRMSEIAGEEWTPAEVQAAIWTYQLPLQDVADAMGVTTKQLLRDGFQLSEKELDKVPSFAKLLSHEANQKAVRTIRSRRTNPIPEIGLGEGSRPEGGALSQETGGAAIPDISNQPF